MNKIIFLNLSYNHCVFTIIPTKDETIFEAETKFNL